MSPLAAPPAMSGLDTSHILGSLGTGGAALVVTVLLILGVKGRGNHKLSHEAAGAIGFIAGTLYLAAGQIWAFAGSMTTSVTSIVSGPKGMFGDVGLGAVALVLFAWWWLGKPRPGKAALLGVMSGSLFAAAGGIWAIASDMVLMMAAHLGVQ